METPLVSIISLCYNQAEYCIDTLDSIYNQTYSNVEIILIDDGSIDNSVEIIEAWIAKHIDIKIRFIVHKKNKGICKSLNEAVSYSKGKYIQLIACDDIMLAEKTKIQVAILEKNTEIGLLFSDVYLFGDTSTKYETFFSKRGYTQFDTQDVYKTLIRKGNIIHPLSQMVRTDLLKESGGFDEDLSFEDYDFVLRFSRTYKVLFSNYISARYRIHNNNTSKKLSSEHVESYIKLYEKHLGFSRVYDKVLRKKIILSILAAIIGNYNNGLKLLKRYQRKHSIPWLIRIIASNKYLFYFIFYIPFHLRFVYYRLLK